MSRKTNVFKYSLILTALLVNACSNNSESTDSPSGPPVSKSSSIKIPEPIQSAAVETQRMTAILTISDIDDVNISQQFTLNISGDQAQQTIELNPGTYIFEIEFKYNFASPGDTVLAFATSSEITINAGSSTPVSFNETGYTYPDSDDDGVTNLAEIDDGTDPFNPPDTTSPTVDLTVPIRDATDVLLNTEISVTFSEDVLGVNDSSFTLADGSGAIAGNVTYDNTNFKATFSPESPLIFSESYTINLGSAITDLIGNAISFSPLVFTTVDPVDSTRPTVTETTPLRNTDNVPTDVNITVTFSEYVLGVDNTSFTIVGGSGSIAGSVTYDSVAFTANFIQASPLNFSENYTINLSSNITDSAGNSLNFIPLVFSTVDPVDSTPPTVTETTPLRNANNVPTDNNITVTFSEHVLGVDNTSFTITGDSGSIAGIVTYDNVAFAATFTLESPLSFSENYTLNLGSNITDSAGNSLNFTPLLFTTIAAPDTTPPTVELTSPLPNAIDVTLNSSISLTFSESVLAVDETSFTVVSENFGQVTGSVTYDDVNFRATFTPAIPMRYYENYTVNLAANITDLAGNPVNFTPFTFKSIGQAAWARLYRGSRKDKIFDIEVLDDDSYIVTGETSSVGATQYDAWIARINVDGSIAWQKTIGTGSNGVQSTLTSDGHIMMTLRAADVINSVNVYKSWLVKLRISGELLWIKEINDNTRITSIAPAESGYFVVAGVQNDSAWSAKFANDGTIQWNNTYGLSIFNKIRHDADGSFITVGLLNSVTNDTSSFLIKLNQTDGAIIFQRQVATANRDTLQDVMPTGSSGYVAVGKYQPTDFSSISGWVVNFDSNGGINWQKYVLDMEYRAVLPTSDNGVIAVGGNGANYDMFISKFDSNQQLQWQSEYGGYNFDVLTSLHPLRDGGFVTGGYMGSFQGGLYDAIFMKMVQSNDIRFFHAASDAKAEYLTVPTVINGTASSTVSNVGVTAVTNTLVTNPLSTVVDSNFVIENIRGTTGGIATPTNVQAFQSAVGENRITWNDAASNETGYIIFRSEDDGITFKRDYLAPVGQNVTEFVDNNNIVSGTTYHYKIVGYNADGYSNFSTAAIVTAL